MSLLTIEDKLVVTVSGGQRKLSTHLRCCHGCYACDCRNCDETPAIDVDFTVTVGGVSLSSLDIIETPKFIYQEEIDPWPGIAIFNFPLRPEDTRLRLVAGYSLRCIRSDSPNDMFYSSRGLANKFVLTVETFCSTSGQWSSGWWVFPFLLCDNKTRCAPIVTPELWCPWGDVPPPPPPPGAVNSADCYPAVSGINVKRLWESDTYTSQGLTIISSGAHYGPRALELVASMVPVVQLIENPLP